MVYDQPCIFLRESFYWCNRCKIIDWLNIKFSQPTNPRGPTPCSATLGAAVCHTTRHSTHTFFPIAGTPKILTKIALFTGNSVLNLTEPVPWLPDKLHKRFLGKWFSFSCLFERFSIVTRRWIWRIFRIFVIFSDSRVRTSGTSFKLVSHFPALEIIATLRLTDD